MLDVVFPSREEYESQMARALVLIVESSSKNAISFVLSKKVYFDIFNAEACKVAKEKMLSSK